MIATLSRKADSGYRFAPVVHESALAGFLAGSRSLSSAYEEVPPSITLRRGFWFVPCRPMGPVRALLVSTINDHHGLQSAWTNCFVYYSPKYRTAYVGAVVDADIGGLLLPHIADEFPPLDLSTLEYVGRVLGAR